LHVLHDLGGGVERWCRDYCRADTARLNLILKPFCRGHAAGEGLMLFAGIDDAEPIGLWLFATPFEVTATTHPEYAKVVRDIVAQYAVEAVLVSSLIGHTLDVLTTGVPTAFIAHDYFPACPAINLYFDGVCADCDDARLVDCLKRNPDFNPFLLFSADERLAVRKGFLDILENGLVTVVVPCRVVWAHLLRLFPGLSKASWVTIPHGVDGALTPIRLDDTAAGEKLRVVMLGMLSVNKGMRVLADALDRLAEFAEIHLVGAMEVGEMFVDHPGVHVVTRYALDELPTVLREIRPHAGMLLSIWPETFSYTLSELMRLGVPPVATRVGGFAERIIDGETGYLVEPTADDLVARLKQIDADRASLARVRTNLAALPRRGAADMVADYHRLLPLSAADRAVPAGPPAVSGPADMLGIHQAVALSAMWKQIKSLDLQLTMSRAARPRLQGPGQIAESQRLTAERQREAAEHQRAMAEHQRSIAEHQRAVAEQQRALAEVQFSHERQRLADQLTAAVSARQERDKALAERDTHIHALAVQLDGLNRHIAEIHSSTSWRLSSPIRAVGTFVRRTRIVTSLAAGLLADPQTLPKHVSMLYEAWRSGGIQPLKATVRNLQAALAHQNAWKIYHQTFESEVKPQVIHAVAVMPRRPLISVIVPTYNTERTMLAQMLASVQGQLYGNWELCIADDCSSEPHVADMLRAAAAADSRIKLHLSPENRGVAHASNRALDLAGGEFVVLLDHDDLLEPQALFRVAQALIAEGPDMIYSDEIMLSADLKKVLQYAFRPAFSPEFLRSHPYIVHMVGFRAGLLREIGGFDETLAISQDYDLILRAAERADVVTHIPEILYQWRIHASSSGTRKMEDVMATSKAILGRHLERGGEAGQVDDGARFNLFDVRYPLREGLRVAIVIPTKNHGDLVRQCVDSIRATAGSVACDIVVIDHESDDPETMAYLASIDGDVTVLRYSGPFNFSAINNWAIQRLTGPYTHYLLCNNDIEAIHPGWLERMLELGQHEDVGIVGAQLLYPDRVTIQHAGVCVGAFGAAEHYAKFIRVTDVPLYLGFSEILASNHEVSAVTAACLLIRQDAFAAVHGFDEALAVGFGDVDLCLRVGQLGYRVLYCPHAELLHHESFTRGKTTGKDPHPEDSALFQARWQGFLHAGDPYFNPGLNQNSTAWQMRQPMLCGFAARRRVFRRDTASGRHTLTSSG
jgi:GT2 family glycosyltransferase/glycosyltransferase involved in cell wall biosynthesis